MIRGFVLGILGGGAVSVLGLGIVSYVSPPSPQGGAASVQPVAPGDAVPAVTAPADPTPAQDLTDKTTPAETEAAATIPDAPAGAVTPDAAPVASDATKPAASAPNPAATKPDPPPDGAKVATEPTGTTQGETVQTPAAGPETPLTPPVAVVVTSPVPLEPAATDATSTLDVPAVAAVDDASPAARTPDTLVAVTPDLAPKVPAAPAAPPKVARGTPPALATAPLPEADAPPVVADLPAPAIPAQPETLPAVMAEAMPAQTDPPPPPPKEPKPRILTEDVPLDDAETATLVPASRLDGKVAGVVTGRLPRIGDAAAPPEDAPETDAPAKTPLVEFARAFENPDQKPVFSIVLIDSNAPDLDRKALADLPFPVSFAIDPLSDKAAEHAAIYRAAGQEVLMLAAGIPQGATASDLEVSLAALSDRMPEAVAMLEQRDPIFQDNRPLATQIVPILAAQGRGLVTWDEGLNAADQVARREGLPSVMAFRSLDSDNEGAETMRRYLDRAAFRAAQDGRVVVVGTTRPETVKALIAWGLEGRSATVALAPISAALTVN